jgi:hypothetical protein
VLIVSVSCDEAGPEMNNSPIQQVCVTNADGTDARNLSDPAIDGSSSVVARHQIALTSMFAAATVGVLMNADGSDAGQASRLLRACAGRPTAPNW